MIDKNTLKLTEDISIMRDIARVSFLGVQPTLLGRNLLDLSLPLILFRQFNNSIYETFLDKSVPYLMVQNSI